MADKDSGPEAGIKGVVEEAKGKAKEAAGTVLGNDALQREGSAQQDKAESQRELQPRRPRQRRPVARLRPTRLGSARSSSNQIRTAESCPTEPEQLLDHRMSNASVSRQAGSGRFRPIRWSRGATCG